MEYVLIDIMETGLDIGDKVAEPFLKYLNMDSLSKGALACADRIFQSIEYFFERDKRMIGQMIIAFPFAAARSLVTRLLQL